MTRLQYILWSHIIEVEWSWKHKEIEWMCQLDSLLFSSVFKKKRKKKADQWEEPRNWVFSYLAYFDCLCCWEDWNVMLLERCVCRLSHLLFTWSTTKLQICKGTQAQKWQKSKGKWCHNFILSLRSFISYSPVSSVNLLRSAWSLRLLWNSKLLQNGRDVWRGWGYVV